MRETDFARHRRSLHELQMQRLEVLLRQVRASNPFYQKKLDSLAAASSETDLTNLPFTTKAELVADQAQHPPYGSNLSFPIDHYGRIHQTSGTSGHPVRWLDTTESFAWFVECWRENFAMAGVGRGDRIFVAFSFGPFIGFWGAFEAAAAVNALAIPGGGMDTDQRLRAIVANEATVLTCTPTYALRLAHRAEELGINLRDSALRVSFHGGEPGASIPAVRARIEESFGVRCFDHVGATEIGAWGASCGVEDHVHILEEHFIPELLEPTEGEATSTERTGARQGELVLTNLGRLGSPVIRYRTGDLVEWHDEPCPCGRPWVWLRGGVLGRRDDMVVIRGVNVFPSALEGIVREIPAIDEFRVEVHTHREMAELRFSIEVPNEQGARAKDDLARLLRDRLSLSAQIEVAPHGSLPRFELKSRRFEIIRDVRDFE